MRKNFALNNLGITKKIFEIYDEKLGKLRLELNLYDGRGKNYDATGKFFTEERGNRSAFDHFLFDENLGKSMMRIKILTIMLHCSLYFKRKIGWYHAAMFPRSHFPFPKIILSIKLETRNTKLETAKLLGNIIQVIQSWGLAVGGWFLLPARISTHKF